MINDNMNSEWYVKVSFQIHNSEHTEVKQIIYYLLDSDELIKLHYNELQGKMKYEYMRELPKGIKLNRRYNETIKKEDAKDV